MLIKKVGLKMGEFTKDPGGHKMADSGDGVIIYDPGAGGGYMKDPGTGI